MGRNIPLMLSTLGETWGLSSVAAWRLCCRWASLPAGDEGCGVTDDSELVGLSDRVMAGRHRLMDQARREGMEGEEGSLAALFFSPGRCGRWRKRGEKQIQERSSGSCVPGG